LMRLDGEVVEDAHVGAALAQWAARVTEQPHEQTDVAEWNAVRSPVQTRATLVTVCFGCALRIAALNPAWPCVSCQSSSWLSGNTVESTDCRCMSVGYFRSYARLSKCRRSNVLS
jgi:hypothetical protein